jgi:methyl halide transferase
MVNNITKPAANIVLKPDVCSMAELNEEAWSARYRQNNTAWDLGAPSPPLKEYINTLTDKSLRILIPGAGNAHEAEYLWQQGFSNTVIVDLATEPLENFKSRVADFPANQAIHANFFELEGEFDLILEQTFFCAINPSLRPAYAKHIHKLLAPMGILAGVLFNAPKNADRPPFGGTAAEYKTYFDPYFNYSIYKPCQNSIPSRSGQELFIELVKK